MAEDQATISSRCRDEKMAKKMNLPFRFEKKTNRKEEQMIN